MVERDIQDKVEVLSQKLVNMDNMVDILDDITYSEVSKLRNGEITTRELHNKLGAITDSLKILVDRCTDDVNEIISDCISMRKNQTPLQ